MKASDIAAWWGAGLATLVLCWDVYKWRLGRVSSLKVEVDHDETGRMELTIINTGTKPAAIEYIILFAEMRHDDASFIRTGVSRWNYIDAKQELPFRLEPGECWRTMIQVSDPPTRMGWRLSELETDRMWFGVEVHEAYGPSTVLTKSRFIKNEFSTQK